MADLPGGPAAAVEQAVLEHDAGADAGGDLDEDRAVVAAGHAVRCSARAPRLASLSMCTSTPKRCGHVAALTPTQPGRIAEEQTTPSVIGAGRPRPKVRIAGGPCRPLGEQLLEQCPGRSRGPRCAGGRRRGGGAPRRAGCR